MLHDQVYLPEWRTVIAFDQRQAAVTEVLAGASLGVTTLAQVSGLFLRYRHFAGVDHRS